jgi:DNA-binding MarR family transcriptional regulator
LVDLVALVKSLKEFVMVFFFGGDRRIADPTMLETKPASPGIVGSLIGLEQRARALRHEIFDDSVITEAMWPLLQDLLTAQIAGRSVRTKELCSTSALPQTTVLRYLDHLEAVGIVQRDSDPGDHRVTLLKLTREGSDWLMHFYSELLSGEMQLIGEGQGLQQVIDLAIAKVETEG